MNCLQNLPRSYLVPQKVGTADPRVVPPVVIGLEVLGRRVYRNRAVNAMNVSSDSISSPENKKNKIEDGEQKSETYSHNMTQAMGAVLTYRHELGMNYNFILPDLIVGSCLQNPADVDKLREVGVKTIFCLQQDPDLEYFDVDISAIQKYAMKCKDIKHYRAEIRDFDAFDLRMRLPTIISELHHAVQQNGGITYIHCTAGLGRAPAVALAYMFWVREYRLSEAHEILLKKRPCFPKLEAIKGATADIITGLSKNTVRLMWDDNDCSSVEVSGLDIGWGQRIPLSFDEAAGAWILERELPEGKYEYKYIIDGDWTVNEYELLTQPNRDGHVNNYIDVHDSGVNIETRMLRERLTKEDVDLSQEERKVIKDYLDYCKHGK